MNNNFNQGYNIKSGQQNWTGTITQNHSGSGDNVGGDKTPVHYPSPDLIQAAEEIKKLLEILQESYPINTISDRMRVAAKAIEVIENNPSLKARFVNALKQGGRETFHQLVDGPVIYLLLAAGEDLIDNKAI